MSHQPIFHCQNDSHDSPPLLQVIGCHMVGPDSAEIMQGLGIALKCGATKAQFDSTVGIHPSAAEEWVTMSAPVRWGSGKDFGAMLSARRSSWAAEEWVTMVHQSGCASRWHPASCVERCSPFLCSWPRS